MSHAPLSPPQAVPDVVEPTLGRRLTIEDIARGHRNRTECICRGTAVFIKIERGQSVPKVCERALNRLRRLHGKDLRDTPNGPYWIKGHEPDAERPAAEA